MVVSWTAGEGGAELFSPQLRLTQCNKIGAAATQQVQREAVSGPGEEAAAVVSPEGPAGAEVTKGDGGG